MYLVLMLSLIEGKGFGGSRGGGGFKGGSKGPGTFGGSSGVNLGGSNIINNKTVSKLILFMFF